MSTTRERTVALAREGQPALVRAWAGQIQGSGMAFGRRSLDEIQAHCGEALEAVLGVLEGRGIPDQPPTRGFGQGEVLIDAHPLDSAVAFLLGQQVVNEHLRGGLEPHEMVTAGRIVGEVFAELAPSYGQVRCQSCMARQDERRRRVELQLESVIERSPDAIVLFGDDRGVSAWNRSAQELFGYAPEEILGRSMDILVPPERLQRGEGRLLTEEVLSRGHTRLAETERVRKDGTLVWVDASYTVVRDAEGRCLGIWAVFRDMSERKRLEEAKLQAERLALIGTMSAKLAHEVRNPLTSIVLNLDLVRDTIDTMKGGDGAEIGAGTAAAQESLELLGSIGSEVQRIQAVVEDYLRFARLPRLMLAPLHPDELLSRHMEMVRPELEGHGIALTLDLDAPHALMPADENQLWQAVLNLVRNAMEAMPQGGELRVGTRMRGPVLQIEIVDTGSGMPAEVRASIFRPFFSTKRGGTGLGLPLTHQIVTEHGGRLECTSAPGQGTKFVMSLPLLDLSRMSASSSSSSSTSSGAAAHPAPAA